MKTNSKGISPKEKEAVAFYDRERRRNEIKALVATDPKEKARFNRLAACFRGMRNAALDRLCGIDRNRLQFRRLGNSGI